MGETRVIGQDRDGTARLTLDASILLEGELAACDQRLGILELTDVVARR